MEIIALSVLSFLTSGCSKQTNYKSVIKKSNSNPEHIFLEEVKNNINVICQDSNKFRACKNNANNIVTYCSHCLENSKKKDCNVKLLQDRNYEPVDNIKTSLEEQKKKTIKAKIKVLSEEVQDMLVACKAGKISARANAEVAGYLNLACSNSKTLSEYKSKDMLTGGFVIKQRKLIDNTMIRIGEIISIVEEKTQLIVNVTKC
jgi:hypothetical protein